LYRQGFFVRTNFASKYFLRVSYLIQFKEIVTSIMIALFVTITIYIVLYVFIEVAKRKFLVENAFSRNVAHVSTGILSFFLPYYLMPSQIVVLMLLIAGLLFYTKRARLLPGIHVTGRKSFGEIYYPLGIGVSALVCLPGNIVSFQFGIWILTLSDTLAGMIGGRFGGKKISFWSKEKTVKGTLSFFIMTFIISGYYFFIIGKFNMVEIFLLTFILTFIEFILVSGLDNLVLPVLASSLFMLLV